MMIKNGNQIFKKYIMKIKSILALWFLLLTCSFTTIAQQKNTKNNMEDTALLKPHRKKIFKEYFVELIFVKNRLFH